MVGATYSFQVRYNRYHSWSTVARGIRFLDTLSGARADLARDFPTLNRYVLEAHNAVPYRQGW